MRANLATGVGDLIDQHPASYPSDRDHRALGLDGSPRARRAQRAVLRLAPDAEHALSLTGMLAPDHASIEPLVSVRLARHAS